MLNHIKRSQDGPGVMNYSYIPDTLLDRLIVAAAKAVGLTEDDLNKKIRFRAANGQRTRGMHKALKHDYQGITESFVTIGLSDWSVGYEKYQHPQHPHFAMDVALKVAERWFRLIVHELKHAADRYNHEVFSHQTSQYRRPKWAKRPEEIRAMEAEKAASLPDDDICDLAQLIYDRSK